MESFVAPLLGGVLIGLSAAGLLLMNGKIAGVSGIAGALLGPRSQGDVAWRVAFVAGLLLAGAAAASLSPQALRSEVVRSAPALVIAGLLVGIGTRIGGGCTSGHGVCGVGRLSVRSLVATVTFIATGAITVFVVEHVLGGVV